MDGKPPQKEKGELQPQLLLVVTLVDRSGNIVQTSTSFVPHNARMVNREGKMTTMEIIEVD
jgi:hypothetical protein